MKDQNVKIQNVLLFVGRRPHQLQHRRPAADKALQPGEEQCNRDACFQRDQRQVGDGAQETGGCGRVRRLRFLDITWAKRNP